jgi:hypothetical protein
VTRHHHAGRLAAALAALALLTTVFGVPRHAAAAPAQVEASNDATLRDRVLERFDVRGLQDGISLIPRTPLAGVRLIDIAGGTVSINGQTVTGGELQDRLGQEAATVLQLSYLSDPDRLALFGLSVPEGTAVAPPAPPPAPRVPLRRGNSRDRVRILGDATVAAGETLPGDLVVVGGRAEVDGMVDGDVVVVAGSLRLGEGADVRGDVVAVAAQLDRAPGARVGGEVVDLGLNNVQFRIGDVELRNPLRLRPRVPRFAGILTTLLRLGLLVILGWLLVAVAGRPVDRIAARAAAEPLKAGVVGLLVELLFVPVLIVVSVLLAASIIGIPLLVLIPVAIIVMVVALLIGFTGVALRVGRWMGARIGADHLEAYGAMTLGMVVLLSLALAARFASLAGGLTAGLGMAVAMLAFCVEYAAWTVGLGAAVLARVAPPPRADSQRRPGSSEAPSPSGPAMPPETPPATT